MTRRRPSLALALVALGCCGAATAQIGCAPAPGPARADGGVGDDDDDALCAPAPAGDLSLDGVVEGEPGYDDALAALDLASAPASLDVSALSAFQRDLVLYMLELDEGTAAVDTAGALDDGGPLGRAVVGAFVAAAGAGAPGELDFAFLRRGLHRFYACARAFPPTLAEFRADVHDFQADAVDNLVDSGVKDLPRRLRRSGDAGVFVAETMLPGDVVRETEIILTDRRTDGRIDFVEYDASGDLRGASAFASSTGAQVTGAVPFTCIACHGYRDVSPPTP